MAIRYEIFPDAEAVVNTVLRDAAITGVTGVHSSIPKTPTFPLIITKRTGGVPVERHHLDRARIQVEVWGNSKSEALDIAQEARTLIHEMEGQQFTDPVDAYVTGVDDAFGLQWLPDNVTHRDRYIFAIDVFLHQ
jgi:hypothetical protein